MTLFENIKKIICNNDNDNYRSINIENHPILYNSNIKELQKLRYDIKTYKILYSNYLKDGKKILKAIKNHKLTVKISSKNLHNLYKKIKKFELHITYQLNLFIERHNPGKNTKENILKRVKNYLIMIAPHFLHLKSFSSQTSTKLNKHNKKENSIIKITLNLKQEFNSIQKLFKKEHHLQILAIKSLLKNKHTKIKNDKIEDKAKKKHLTDVYVKSLDDRYINLKNNLTFLHPDSMLDIVRCSSVQYNKVNETTI